MKPIWKKSILSGTLFAVLIVALAVSTIFVLVTSRITEQRATEAARVRLLELMASAEQAAAIACFADDAILAKETAAGLVLSTDVLSVAILSGDRQLTHVYRKGVGSAAEKHLAGEKLSIPLYSPFVTGERIGSLHLTPNMEAIRTTVFEEIRYVALLLVLLALASVSAVGGVVALLVVRPVKTMSDQLHALDAAGGATLPVPRGHEESELGRLAQDINGLTGRLVTTLKQEHELRLQRELDERKYRAIFENVDAGIFILDHSGRLQSCNPAFMRLMKDSLSDPFHECAESVLAALPWVNREHVSRLVDRCLCDNVPRDDDLEMSTADGHSRWFNLVLRPVGNGLAQGMASDVTERHRAEQEARRKLLVDELTGEPNRAGLEQALRAMIEEHPPESQERFALLLVDLDGFKRVNDALGLPVGDEILRNTARRLKACLYPEDMVSRLGGDEFAILVRADAGMTGVARVAERIVQVLDFSFLVEKAPVKLGASVGITLYPADARDVPSLLRNSELALDRARADGGHGFRFFDSSMAKTAEALRRLDADMHFAVRRNEFRLYLQPIVSLSEGRLVGAEGLLRWQHPERGMVPPDAFIPVAEDTGFIEEIGLWGLEAACRQLARWQLEGKDLYLSLNISGRQIPNGLTPDMLLDATRRHGISPRSLALEITEGILISEDDALDWLESAHEKGFRIYLDDFGTGYSSLSYLKRFPVDVVKVDQSFVRDMHEDSNDRTLVEAVVAMAQSLGMRTLAEGVERAEHVLLLRRMNCQMVQGNHYSRPVPADDFDDVARRITAQLATEQERV